jgi:hypothetical protein
VALIGVPTNPTSLKAPPSNAVSTQTEEFQDVFSDISPRPPKPTSKKTDGLTLVSLVSSPVSGGNYMMMLWKFH